MVFERELEKQIAKLKRENAELRDKVEMLNFFYEGNGFEKRGLHTAIMIADYIDKLEKEKEETRKKVIEIFANDEMQQGELWKACGLRLVGWDYEKNQLDDKFMMLYGVSN